MSDELVQLFVRTEKGATFGPLSPASIELLIDNGIVTGRVQLSLDGRNYVFPGRLPGIRMVIPRALWGAVVEPGEAEDAAWSNVVLPPNLSAPVTSSPSLFAQSAVPGSAPYASTGSMPGGPVPSSASSAMQRPPFTSSPSSVTAGPGARTVNQPARPHVSPALTQPPRLAPMASSSAPPGHPTGLIDFSEHSTDPASIFEGGRSLTGEEIAPSGALSAISPIRLYFLAAGTHRTGLLTFTLADRTIQVHFRKGTPEFVDSNHPDDGLSAFLVKRNLLTPEVIAQAEPQRARFGGELLATLFALGLLNPNTVFAHLGQRAADLIYRALFAEQGQYTWETVELSPAKAVPMGHKWSIFFEQLRRVPAAEVRRRMVPALDLPVMKGQGLVALADLKLSPQETRALNHFDGVRSLNQLAAKLPPEAETMLRTAWMLEFCDVVSFAVAVLNTPRPSGLRPAPVMSAPTPAPASPRPAAVPGNPPGRAPTPQSVSYPTAKPKGPPVVTATAAAVPGPPQLKPVGPPVVTASSPSGAVKRPSQVIVAGAAAAAAGAGAPADPAELKALTQLLERFRAQNFFEVLGVDKEAEPSAVKVAYFKLAKSYHPDTVPPGTHEEIARLKADIFARVGDAQRTLSDAKLREEYTKEVNAGGSGEKVDITKILMAEEYFQKGVILTRARKFPEAVKMLSDAIEASDIEGEYYAWRGWAKFFTFTDKKQGQVEALKDIAICMKKNPNVAAMYYFQGFMAKVLGDMAAAKGHFVKTIALDPRHIDAQRELRMMK